MVALKQPTVDLLRAVRLFVDRTIDTVVFDALQGYLDRRCLQATTDFEGRVLVALSRKAARHKQTGKAKDVTGESPEPVHAAAKSATGNDFLPAERPTIRSRFPEDADRTLARQSDLFGAR